MTSTERNTLIVDAYNANPTSMDAALTNFANVEAPVKIALLGDMLELGEDSLAEHVAVIEKTLFCPLDLICLVGAEFESAIKFMTSQVEGNLQATADYRYLSEKIHWFADSQSLASWLDEQKITGATVLIKGSRGTRMEKTIPSL